MGDAGRGHEVTTLDTGSLSSTAYPSGDGQYYGGCICEQEGGTQSPSLSLLALESKAKQSKER